MIQAVSEAIARHRMLRFGTRIGVAVSGGADSVFLLHVLAELGFASAVIHVNHHLRGAESEEDERFVASLAAGLKIPLSVEHARLPGGNIEQEARRARYEVFSRFVSDKRVDAVATGHNRDDQAETVLYRFLRGSGTAGLSGIRPVTAARIIRPLIGLSRAEIRSNLAGGNIHWRDDSSNADLRFARNRIRHEFLPVLAEFANPALAETLATTAEWAQSEEEFWSSRIEALASDCLVESGEYAILKANVLAKMQSAEQRRVIRHFIEGVRGDLRSIDFRHIESIRALANCGTGSGRVQVPGLDVILSFDLLRLAPLGYDGRQPRNFAAVLQRSGRTVLKDRGLNVRLEPVTNRNVYNNQVNRLDLEQCTGALLLRNWRPGDRFRLHGRVETEKIKTLFQEFQIPIWERRGWPVIELKDPQLPDGDVIVWTRRFGVSPPFAAGPGCSNAYAVLEDSTAVEVTESICNTQASIEVVRAPECFPWLLGNPGAEVL